LKGYVDEITQRLDLIHSSWNCSEEEKLFSNALDQVGIRCVVALDEERRQANQRALGRFSDSVLQRSRDEKSRARRNVI